MKNKGENVSIRDTIRLIDYYDNNIPHIQIENTRYISENAITSFMETSGIQSKSLVIKRLNEEYHTDMTVVTENSDIGILVSLLEELNTREINDINHLDQIVGFMFDKIKKMSDEDVRRSGTKFMALYISKIISTTFFDIAKPLATVAKFTPYGMFMTGTKFAYDFTGLTLSLVNYKGFLKATLAKIKSVKSSLETAKKLFEKTQKQKKDDKEKNNNESKK